MKKAVSIGALAFAVSVAAPVAASAEDWTGYLGGAQQNSRALSDPGNELGTLWRSSLTAPVPACTVLRDGHVFTLVTPEEQPGVARLVSVDAASGSVEWESAAFPAATACPAVDDERVYLVSGWGDVRTFDADTGAPGWTWEDGMNVSLSLDGDAVLLVDTDTLTRRHLALEADDGTVRWEVQDAGVHPSGLPPLGAGDFGVFLDDYDDGATAYSPQTGARLWNETWVTNWVADDGVAFLATDYDEPRQLIARDATGQPLWSRDLPSGQRPMSLVADDQRVYLRAGTNNGNIRGRVIAYDRADGRLLWNVAAENLYDGRIARIGRRLISIGYSGGGGYDPATGAMQTLGDGFSRLSGFAYGDATFYQWAEESPGRYVLEALRDVEAPTLTASTPADGIALQNTRPEFAWSVGDGQGTGVSSVELLLGDRPPVALGAADGAYSPPSPLADGAYRWHLRARDAAGNEAQTPERTVIVDTVAPAPFGLRAPTGGASVADPRPQLEWDATSDATSGVASYAVTIDGAVVATVAGSTCAGDVCRAQAPGALADGPHRWSVAAADAAGNQREASGGSFAVAAAPAGRLSPSAATVATGQALTLTAEFSDPNGSIASYAWDLDGDGAFETTGAGTPQQTARFATVGARTVRVRATDTGGLTATASAEVAVRLAPPPGEVGVSIDGGAVATNRRQVELSVVWPRLATDALISNDGGFGAAGSTGLFPVAQTIRWTLPSSGPERLPKIVYLRFRGGSAGPETYTDDIVLDERAPQLESVAAVAPTPAAPAAPPAARAPAGRLTKPTLRKFRVRARDANSGVAIVQINVSRGTRGAQSVRVVRRNSRGKRRYVATVRLRVPSGRVWIRVVDAAGNGSKWRRTR